MPPVVRPYQPRIDEGWAERFLDAQLGGRRQARRGEIVDVLEPGLGLVAGDRLGLLTYRLDGEALELSALIASPPGGGTGTALLDALVDVARTQGVARIWVVTTNDNLDALAFYQRRGFRLAQLRAGAVDDARRTIKPGISVLGQHGIEMHDEIQLSRVIRRSDPGERAAWVARRRRVACDARTSPRVGATGRRVLALRERASLS